MPRASCILAVLLLAAPALAEEPGRARDLARAALLDGATVPPAAEMPLTDGGDPAGAPHALPHGRFDAEHEAHVRAAEHGARHGQEAHHPARGEGAGGAMHGGTGGPGMDAGADCHDAAGNMRTRRMHDGGGGMDPGHPGMGMKPAPSTAAGATR